MSDYSRLDRIEEKIDKLTDAMVTIARAEEKLVNMEQKYSAQYDRMNKFSENLMLLKRLHLKILRRYILLINSFGLH